MTKGLSGPCFAGPVSGACLSLLAVAAICPNCGGVRVDAIGVGGQATQNVQLALEKPGIWDTQKSAEGNALIIANSATVEGGIHANA